MKEFLIKFWKFLEGKKTLIGLTMLWLVTRVWFLDLLPDGTFEDAVVDILNVLGTILAGVGVAAKGFNWLTAKNDSQPKGGSL